jgi:transcriptional regulator with XRE-family HTH domain/tetratricopeptide (TPR) repeat protein
VTQEHLADAAGISLRSVQRIESGERAASPEQLEALEASLGLEPGSLQAFAAARAKRAVVAIDEPVGVQLLRLVAFLPDGLSAETLGQCLPHGVRAEVHAATKALLRAELLVEEDGRLRCSPSLLGDVARTPAPALRDELRKHHERLLGLRSSTKLKRHEVATERENIKRLVLNDVHVGDVVGAARRAVALEDALVDVELPDLSLMRTAALRVRDRDDNVELLVIAAAIRASRLTGERLAKEMLQRAGSLEKLVVADVRSRYLNEAAAQAMQDNSWTEARRLFERAGDEATNEQSRARVLIQWTELEQRDNHLRRSSNDDHPGVEELVEELRALVGSDAELRARLRFREGGLAWMRHDLPGALRWYDLAADDFDALGLVRMSALSRKEAAALRIALDKEVDRALADVDAAAMVLGRLGDRLGVATCAAHQAWAVHKSNPADAQVLHYVDVALDRLAEADPDRKLMGDMNLLAAEYLRETNQIEDAISRYRTALRSFKAVHNSRGAGYCEFGLARQGRIAAARPHLQNGIEAWFHHPDLHPDEIAYHDAFEAAVRDRSRSSR